jgi:DUF917 family protein
MTVTQLKEAVIPRTVSLAIKLGGKVRKANENGENPVKAIKNVLPDARFIFSGKIESFSRSEEGGFTSGEIILTNPENSRKQLRVWYQNEYLLSWLNDNHYVTCPDGFYIIDSSTGFGLTPWEKDFYMGREVIIFTRDAPEIWQSKKGLDIFGPKVFDATWPGYKRASSFY